jgi:competence protein ComEA
VKSGFTFETPVMNLTSRLNRWLTAPLLAILLSMHATALHALELNMATEAELDGLSGLGPAFTARVMEARANRPFRDWADFIRRVKGVRQTTAEKLSRQGATIQGQPYRPLTHKSD